MSEQLNSKIVFDISDPYVPCKHPCSSPLFLEFQLCCCKKKNAWTKKGGCSTAYS